MKWGDTSFSPHPWDLQNKSKPFWWHGTEDCCLSFQPASCLTSRHTGALGTSDHCWFLHLPCFICPPNGVSGSTSTRCFVTWQEEMLKKGVPCLQGTHYLLVFQPSFLPPHLLPGLSSLAHLMLDSSTLISGIIFGSWASCISILTGWPLSPAKCPWSTLCLWPAHTIWYHRDLCPPLFPQLP